MRTDDWKGPRDRRVIAAGLLLASIAGCGEPPASLPGPESVESGPEVRVRLVAAPELLVQFERPIAIVRSDDRSLVWAGTMPSRFLVRVNTGTIDIGGRRFEHPVTIRAVETGDTPMAEALGAPSPAGALRWSIDAPPAPADGHATFVIGEANAAPHRYRGALELRATMSGVQADNVLPLEHYLAGVVGAEMPALWEMAALEAQAIASRSYAFYTLKKAAEDGRAATFAATTVFQKYGGVEAEHARVAEALAATRGQVLSYRGRAFCAYFHSTCGGQTGRASEVFADADIPPLAGAACGKCGDAPRSRWTKSLSAELVQRALASRTDGDAPIGSVESVEVGDVGSDGRVRYVHVVHALGSLDWRADAFQHAIERLEPDTIWSNDFRIARSDRAGKFLVEGRGYGHGLGLCQYGSQALAKDGKSAREILGVYYPQAALIESY